METTESDSDSTNFVSLFERSTLNEWEDKLPASELSKDTSWSNLRPNQMFRLFGTKLLPESLLFVIEQGLRWKVAYSTVHNALAIQKDGRLEIWRDYCSVPVAKCRILDDKHPQWCRLQWSASGNLLFSARSSEAVDAYDTTGAFCFTIPLPTADSTTFNPLYSVASICSMAHTTDTVWSDRVWILQYDGSLRCYLAGRVSGYHPLSTVDVSGGSSSIAITSTLISRANLMLVAAYGPDATAAVSTTDEKSAIVRNRGVSIWRIVEKEPYLEKFGGEKSSEQQASITQKKSFSLFQQQSKDYILQIVISSDENSAACLTSRGEVMAFRVPSLQLIKIWAIGDEISPRRPNGNFLSGIGWWSQKELMLLYSTGFVATVNFDSDGTTSAVEKNYSAWAQLICASQGHVFLLELTGRPDRSESQQTVGSIVWPLIRFPYSLLQMAGRVFVGAPWNGAEGTSEEGEVETIPCRYSLHEMKAITPPELFKKKLVAGEYEEALTVAQTYCLNADRVYQEQWKKHPVSVETIENFLVKVNLESWILDECLSQIPESLEACKKLVEVGLKLTEGLSKLKTDGDLESKRKEINARYRLIEYRRILDDYEAMISSSTERTQHFEHRYYASIRNKSLFEWSLDLARAGDFSRLNALFTRYGARLFPIWLVLLSNIPETVDFQEYDSLLPKSKERPDWSTKKTDQKADFIKDERFANVVDFKNDDVDAVVKNRPDLKGFVLPIDSKYDQSKETFKKWYELRAIEMEKSTCLPDLAERFLELASTNGFENLDNLREDMGLLRLLNYECALSSQISYEKFKKMQPLEILQLLLKEAPKDVFVKRFEQWAVPFCVRWEQRNEIPAKTLVWKYVVAASEESLRIPLLLCQSFKTKREWWSELIGLTTSDIVRMVSDCLNGCSDARQIDAGFQLIAYIPELDDENEESSDAEIVRSMEDHLTALHLLNVYGIATSYQKLQSIASNEQESIMLLKRLIRNGTTSATAGQRLTTENRGGASKKPDRSATPEPNAQSATSTSSMAQNRLWTSDDWRSLLKDMLKISRTVLPSIGEQKCQELFVDGLLSSKSVDLIDLAAKFLTSSREPKKVATPTNQESQQQQPKLSYDSAVDLIAEAAENYVNESVDARDESLQYARKCLALLESPPDKLIREREFIDALPILEHFDVRDVPARLKLYKNPIRLVEEIFSRRPQAYEEYETLLRLCKLLRVPIADRNESRNLLILCSWQSLKRRDAVACAKFCREIVASNCSAGWRVCSEACEELSTTSPAFNADVRHKLLVFCLSHCDAESLESISTNLKNLKIELLRKVLDQQYERRSDHVPWLMSTWNGIRERHGSSDIVKSGPGGGAMVDWKKDAIYLDPLNFSPDNESKSFSEKNVALFNFLRYLLLTEERDESLLDDVLGEIGSTTLYSHTDLALMSILSVKNDETREKALRSIAPSQLNAQWAMYVHSLMAVKRRGADGETFVGLLKVTPELVIKETYPYLSDEKEGRKVKEWTAKLVEFPEGVDRERFATDEQYRKETIVGLALTTDESVYNQSLHLAEIYSVSQWEVTMSHLEFLFTESGLEAASISDAIKTRRLLEKLASENRHQTHDRLKRNVFPLLNGRDHSMLQLYYAVESKFVVDEDLAAGNAHRANLKQLKQIAADLDYKKLIQTESEALDLLLPYMTAENFAAFAKVATKIPGKNFTLEDVLCVWARKVFTETSQKASVSVSFERCKKVLEKLNCETYVNFVEKSMEKLPTDENRLEFVRLAMEFAKQRDKLAPCVDKLKEWESFLM